MAIRSGLCLAALALLMWNATAYAAGGAYEVDSSPTFELDVYLTTGKPVTLETGNTSPGADPYLRVLFQSGKTVTEVARNDNGAGAPNARVQFSPSVTGYHKVIVHAASAGAVGRTTLYMNGSPLYMNAEVGGSRLTLSLAAGETITTLPLPRGPTIHNVYVLNSAGQLIQTLQSGANQATRRTITAAATQTLVIAGSSGAGVSPANRIRVVVNDAAIAGHDSDGDGLGNELEAQIGTCSSLSQIAGNFECSRASDPRDTDGDGLSDAEELLGLIDQAPYQFLPRWGANPRHKDVFIEVDFNAQNMGQAEYRMSPATARTVAAIYAFTDTNAFRRLANAQSLLNPDLEPGVRVHIDTGIDPMPGAPELDFTTYGNWGGHTYVPPDCSGGACRGAHASVVWPTYLTPRRVGLFHYALGYIGASGSAGHHIFAANLPIGGPGLSDLAGARAFAHEFGHTLGLGHSAPEGAEGKIDPNCKPNFPSLMNYGYLNNLAGAAFSQFSDGYGRGTLNNASLTEYQGISAPTSTESQRYLQQLDDFFGYHVDVAAGSVDWNRDGVFSTTPVRAYANSNGECEWTRYNRMVVPGAQSDASPALVRSGSTTTAFYLRTDKRLAYTRTTSNFNCVVAEIGCGTPFTAAQVVSGSWNTNIDAFDAHRIVVNGSPRYLVVYRKGTTLYEVTLTASFVAGSPVMLPTSIDAMDEFSLAGTEQRVYLLYKSYASMPFLMERSSTGWNAPEFVITTNGEYITNIADRSSPALLLATANDGTQTLYGLFPRSVSGTEGRMSLYTFDFTARRWQPSWALPTEPSVGRPAMAAVPMEDPNALFSTRLHVAWLRRMASGASPIRQTTLVAAPVDGGFQTRFQVASYHDNSWTRARGIDLMFEPGVDSNLRALLTPFDLVADGVFELLDLQLRPRADGITDYVFRNYDEWQYIGIDLCRTLEAAVARFTCREWPF